MMLDLWGDIELFKQWFSSSPRIEDTTTILSAFAFSLVTLALAAILVVMLFVGVRTRMQRGWRSKVIAFNMIIWRSLYLLTHGEYAIPQPWALLFWVVVGAFMLDFMIAFHQTWIVGAFGNVPRMVTIVTTVGLAFFALLMSLWITGF